MRIYHGSSSPGCIRQAEAAAPSYTHGYCWTPYKMTPYDTPYILDNGAWSAFKNSEPWDVDAFVARLGQLDTMPREPDFVVLPDVVTNPEQTVERASKWAPIIDADTALPVQDGIEPERAVEVCERLDAGTIFVGGTHEFKRMHGRGFVETAHNHGLDCHIARPGPKGILWADEIGADSVDTSTIAADADYDRLVRLEGGQQRITEVAQ